MTISLQARTVPEKSEGRVAQSSSFTSRRNDRSVSKLQGSMTASATPVHFGSALHHQEIRPCITIHRHVLQKSPTVTNVGTGPVPRARSHRVILVRTTPGSLFGGVWLPYSSRWFNANHHFVRWWTYRTHCHSRCRNLHHNHKQCRMQNRIY